jgi:outer membrane cobalamin receptor
MTFKLLLKIGVLSAPRTIKPRQFKSIVTANAFVAFSIAFLSSQSQAQTVQSSSKPAVTEEIVIVTARRGQARGRPTPLRTIDRNQLEAARDLSIDEVIKRLTQSGQNSPTALINGRLAGTTIQVGGLTSRAIERIEILPPSTAAAYGEPVSGPVINIVLKRQFRSTQLAVSKAQIDEAIGQGGDFNAQHTNLNGDKNRHI